MSEPTKQTIKQLFALSGNICAFPGCSVPLVENSGVVTGRICHIHAQSPGGPRFNPKLSKKQIHSFDNLILMCGRHHSVIDEQQGIYTAEVLKELKSIHEEAAGRTEQTEDAFFAQLLMNASRPITITENAGNVAINSPGAIQAQHILVNTSSSKIAIKAPGGTLGSDIVLSKYISHLIKRYNEFASKDPTRKGKFSFSVISKNIESKFGAKWQLLEMEFSQQVIEYLQGRILRTRQGRINTGKGYPSFSGLEEYQVKYGAR